MSENIFDYIIIGGGTAGCLLANRLSANATKRVLMIEAGRKDDYHWIHIPIGYLHCIGNPRTDWLYQTEAEPGLNGRSLRYPRGKTLGGSSSINGMIYMRGQARDYDRWAELTGDAAWRWDSALASFRQHENHYKLDAANGPVTDDFKRLHGHKSQHAGSEGLAKKMGGEWRVDKQRLRWDILDAFSQAAQQTGIPATDDFNGGDNEGVGYFEVNQKDGLRWNTAKAFLRPTCFGRLTAANAAPALKFGLATNASRPSPHATRAVCAAKSFSAPAVSARRTFCNSPASARPRCSSNTALRLNKTYPALAPTYKTTCKSDPSTKFKPTAGTT
jgi:choline dehydrogenase